VRTLRDCFARVAVRAVTLISPCAQNAQRRKTNPDVVGVGDSLCFLKNLPSGTSMGQVVDTPPKIFCEFVGIDPGELTPFQGGTVYWTVPGVETLVAPSGHKNKPKERLS